MNEKKIKSQMLRKSGTRVLHLSLGDWMMDIRIVPQTLGEVFPWATWLPEVHIGARTLQGMETCPDVVSALDEGLRMLRVDCLALIAEIDERFA